MRSDRLHDIWNFFVVYVGKHSIMIWERFFAMKRGDFMMTSLFIQSPKKLLSHPPIK